MSRTIQLVSASKKLFCSECLNLSARLPHDLSRLNLMSGRLRQFVLPSFSIPKSYSNFTCTSALKTKSCTTNVHSELLKRHSSTNRQLPPKSSQSKNQGAEKSPVSWKTVAVVGTICGLGLCAFKYVKQEKEQAMRRQKQVGKPLLGGPWELTDHNGKRRSNEDFYGQWILLYFGFTNCPDICPDYVEKIVNFVGQCDADKAMPSIQPIVITVDPDRDTAEALKDYLAEFSPKLLGMTGTKDDINKATRAYRVYYSMGPKDEDNDYIVDHSIISYLVNPKGEFVDYFGQNKTADEMFSTTQKHVKKFKL